MRQLFQILCLVVALSACSGCAAFIENLIHAACGENTEERRDRQRMESYREHWSTPGRTGYEIETEARGTFRKAYGRDPNLNWDAR